jgi:hypothetical protein
MLKGDSDRNNIMRSLYAGYAVAQLVEARRHQPEGRGFDGVIEIFH